MEEMEELVLSDDPDGLLSMVLCREVPLTSEERRKITTLAAGIGNMRCLRLLSCWGYPLSDATWDAAAAGGHLQTLRFLHEGSGVPCGNCTTASAARSGHLHCLKYLHSINASWAVCTTRAAAFGGQLECLEHLIRNGCPIGPSACSAAARNGHIECLRFLHLQSCPWDRRTTRNAVMFGRLSCLQYAVERGCPVDDDAFVVALEAGNFQCLDYLLRAGHRPKVPLKLRRLPDDSQVGCFELAASCRVRFSAGQLLLAASLGKLRHVRVFHSLGYPLWQSAVDQVRRPPCMADWIGWCYFLELLDSRWDSGVLHLPPTDEHLRACWGTLRFGSLHGAHLTPRAEALVRERQACAQEVVRCFHAARWRAQGGGPAASKWDAMSRMPADVLVRIMELAEVELHEALRCGVTREKGPLPDQASWFACRT